MAASLIGRSGSSAFRLSNVAVSMSLAGSRFSSNSATAVQYAELFAKYPPDNEQRLDQLGQIGEVLDQLPDARLELDRSHDPYLETEVSRLSSSLTTTSNSGPTAFLLLWNVSPSLEATSSKGPLRNRNGGARRAKLLTKDEARTITLNIAKSPELLLR